MPDLQHILHCTCTKTIIDNVESYEPCTSHSSLTLSSLRKFMNKLLTTSPYSSVCTLLHYKPPPLDLTRYGVEPNPGPKSSRPIVREITKAFKALMVPPPMRLKAKLLRPKKKPSDKGLNMASNSSLTVMGPVSRGVVRQGPSRQAPITIPFTSFILQAQMNIGSDIAYVRDGVISSAAQGTGFAGTSLTAQGGIAASTPSFLQSLPTVLVNVASSFARWRYKKLFLEFSPVQPTSASGSIAIAIVGDGSSTNASTATSYAGVASTYNSLITPIWNRAKLDVTSNLNPGWHFVDLVGTSGTSAVNEAIARQVSPAVLMVSTSGCVSTINNYVIGNIVLSGEIELQDLIDTKMI